MQVSRTTIGWLAVLSLTAAPLAAQSVATDDETIARLESEIRYMAEDARDGRGVGTEGIDEAARYIADRFRAAGLQPAGAGGYFQPFEISPTAPGVAHTDLGGSAVKNVIGVLPGRGTLAGQVVVLGAHYDHLGLGIAAFSLDPDSVGVVHNGADDNASGTVALMEAARQLATRESANRRTLVFVAFTAEELGTIGSQYYTAHPVQPNDSTVAMLNFDMVGRLRGDSLVVVGVGSAEELTDLVRAADADYGLTLAWQQDPWGRSDHSSFYVQGIPVVQFFTDLHEDYHRTTDDWQKINLAGIEKIASLAAELAWELATREEPLTFVSVERPEPPATGRRRASLGTIPDMTDSPGGVRLTGVRSGSAAEEAGLQAGDIIVQIGDFEVRDLQGLQNALVSLSAGDTVTIVYLRDGERRETRATLR